MADHVVEEKKKGKRKRQDSHEEADKEIEDPPLLLVQDPEHLSKKAKKWQNKTRVLVLCARGVTYRVRHLMNDVRALLPHSRSDNKVDRSEHLSALIELCEIKNCTKCIFFEMRKKKDIYMWISQLPNGPSAKFLIENVHTMNELKLTGNCLLGSRPIISFDMSMEDHPHYRLLKELFTGVFSTPYYHPRSKPFIDHIFHFGLLDDHLWFRNYQIVEDGRTLNEIGPRFTMNLIKIFAGSFGGRTLYENPKYQTPNAVS
jgi:ribosome biogenesis protein BRX1